jgi:hypothetical protein
LKGSVEQPEVGRDRVPGTRYQSSPTWRIVYAGYPSIKTTIEYLSGTSSTTRTSTEEILAVTTAGGTDPEKGETRRRLSL